MTIGHPALSTARPSFCDSAGKAIRAHLIDYKTDHVTTESEAQERARTYANQMETYRRATALLLGIPLTEVTTQLLFTKIPLLADC